MLVVLTALVVSLRAETPVSPPVGDQDESILVLQSGEILWGKVSILDDRYLVVLPAGRIFVPKENVEMVCANMQEAYKLRRSRIGHGQAQDHAELAQWCQRHGLDAEAEEELGVARQLDPDHPIVGLVERRLEASRLSHDVVKTSHDEPVNDQPSARQLEDFAAGLPQGTVEVFTRVIQPLLLNRCVTAGCHTDRSDNEFRLERPRPGMPLGRTSTHRNLLATLRLVDSAAPEQSELLRPRKCPNRINTDANLSLSKSGQYRYLVAWINAMPRQSARASSTSSSAASGLPDTIRNGPPARSLQGQPSPSVDAPNHVESPLNFATSVSGQSEPPQASREPSPTDLFQPVDPFDPAIFNQRYGTSAPAPAEPVPSRPVPAPSPGFAG